MVDQLAARRARAIGSAGLTGKVDGHFVKRLGWAVLLSLVSGVGSLASGSTSMILSSSGASAASTAAQRNVAIPPAIEIPQCQPIRISNPHDLDFWTMAEEDAER